MKDIRIAIGAFEVDHVLLQIVDRGHARGDGHWQERRGQAVNTLFFLNTVPPSLTYPQIRLFYEKRAKRLLIVSYAQNEAYKWKTLTQDGNGMTLRHGAFRASASTGFRLKGEDQRLLNRIRIHIWQFLHECPDGQSLSRGFVRTDLSFCIRNWLDEKTEIAEEEIRGRKVEGGGGGEDERRRRRSRRRALTEVQQRKRDRQMIVNSGNGKEKEEKDFLFFNPFSPF